MLAVPELHSLSRVEHWQVIGWSSAATFIGVLAAWFLYRYQLEFTHRLSDMLVTPARWVRAGFAFDDLYRWSFVRPTVAVSNAVADRGIERFLFERLIVGGSVRVTQLVVNAARKLLQSGVVSVYLATFAIGVVLIALYFLSGVNAGATGN